MKHKGKYKKIKYIKAKRVKRKSIQKRVLKDPVIQVKKIEEPKLNLKSKNFSKVIISILLLILAVISFNVGIIYASDSTSPIVNQIDLSKQKVEMNERPEVLYIPSQNIKANVKLGAIKNGTWELEEDYAMYAQGSSTLSSEFGNVIIYAHAKKELFMNLKDTIIGSNVIVYSSDKLYEYEIIEKELILPSEVNEIKKIGPHHLTLFTCDGPDDEYRLVVRAKKLRSFNLTNFLVRG